MKQRLVVVIDVLDPDAVDALNRRFMLDELTADLVQAGLSEAPIFIGKLEDAPDAWAYLLLTDEEEMAERAQQHAVIKQRLERSLGATHVPQRAAKLAETLGLLGVVDKVGSSWFGPRRKEANAANFLFVKRAVAAQLGWPLFPMNSSENYASTRTVTMPLPNMIVKYLEAALGPAA